MAVMSQNSTTGFFVPLLPVKQSVYINIRQREKKNT